MKRQPRVVWSSGTFLTPQLFEAQERFFEREMSFRSSLGGFARWGISDLEIDAGALANGIFRLTRCVGAFVDGFAFSMPDAEAPPAQRNFLLDQGSLNVALALPAKREKGRNISNSEKLRYTSEDQTIYSDLDGQEETIQVAQPRFDVVFSGEPTTGLDTLPIARIVAGKDGGYALAPDYIPPCLNVACNSYLWDVLLPKLRNRLEFVSAQLSGQRSKRSELLADFGDSDIRRFWVLHIVNRALPELKHIHAIGHCHPEELYRFLLRLGGALFTFWGPDDVPKEEIEAADTKPEYFPITGFPVYKHEDLGSCLPRTVTQIETMLRTLVYRRRRCQIIPLAVVKAGRQLKGTVAAEHIEQGALFLAVRKDPSVAIADIPESLKIVGRTTAANANTQAGLELSQEPRAPADCAQQDGYVYYRILEPPAAATILAASSAATTVPGRTGSRPDRESIALRRLEVWQDIDDKKEVHIVILNPANVTKVDLLAVSPEALGYAPLPGEPRGD